MQQQLIARLESKLKIISSKVITKLTESFGVNVDVKVIKEDGYTDVYGYDSGRSSGFTLLSTNNGPYTFASGTETLNLSINGGDAVTVTFTIGSRTGTQVALAINAVVSKLAKTDYFQQITLKARTSIEILSTSTAHTVLGFTVGESENQTIINLLLFGDTFTVSDGFSIGAMESFEAYDASDTLKEGNVVLVNRGDGRHREFKVGPKLSLGSTTDIVSRFVLSSINEESI